MVNGRKYTVHRTALFSGCSLTVILGPLVYFRVFGREFVVVNAWKEAVELFEHRSAIYCTKPRMV
jgi:hypothetical protein